MFFYFNSRYPIGLDISDLALRVVQLNKVHDKIRIQAIGSRKLATGIVDQGAIKNEEALISALKDLLGNPQYGKITSKEVAACLPEKKTFAKLINIDEDKITGEAVEREMEKHFPYSAGELYYDWQEIGGDENGKNIFVGAAPRDVVEQYTDTLKKAGLFLIGLEIEPVAIARALLREENGRVNEIGKNYGIIDIGAKRTGMTFYSKDSIVFTMSLPISGNKVTEEISAKLKITLDQAERAKIVIGFDESKAKGVIKKILDKKIGDLNKKIKEGIEYYNDNYGERGPIEKILLCGRGANIKDIDKIISKQVLVEARIANPLINLHEKEEKFDDVFAEKYNFKTDSKQHPVSQSGILSYTTAIGLALKEIFCD